MHACPHVLPIPQEGTTDFDVDVAEVVSLLRRQLGKQLEANYSVAYDYDWPKAIKGV